MRRRDFLKKGTALVAGAAMGADLAGCGDGSNPVQPLAPPASPANLLATSLSAGSIGLEWSDTSDNEAGFRIERHTENDAFASIATVAAGVTTYTDSGLAADTVYSYQVVAFNDAGSSAPSGIGSAKTLGPVDFRHGVTTIAPRSDTDRARGNKDRATR